jgi:hypothetical protein
MGSDVYLYNYKYNLLEKKATINNININVNVNENINLYILKRKEILEKVSIIDFILPDDKFKNTKINKLENQQKYFIFLNGDLQKSKDQAIKILIERIENIVGKEYLEIEKLEIIAYISGDSKNKYEIEYKTCYIYFVKFTKKYIILNYLDKINNIKLDVLPYDEKTENRVGTGTNKLKINNYTIYNIPTNIEEFVSKYEKPIIIDDYYRTLIANNIVYQKNLYVLNKDNTFQPFLNIYDEVLFNLKTINDTYYFNNTNINLGKIKKINFNIETDNYEADKFTKSPFPIKPPYNIGLNMDYDNTYHIIVITKYPESSTAGGAILSNTINNNKSEKYKSLINKSLNRNLTKKMQKQNTIKSKIIQKKKITISKRK